MHFSLQNFFKTKKVKVGAVKVASRDIGRWGNILVFFVRIPPRVRLVIFSSTREREQKRGHSHFFITQNYEGV